MSDKERTADIALKRVALYLLLFMVALIWVINDRATEEPLVTIDEFLKISGSIVGLIIAALVWGRSEQTDMQIRQQREREERERVFDAVRMLGVEGNAVQREAAVAELESALKRGNEFDDLIWSAVRAALPQNEYPATILKAGVGINVDTDWRDKPPYNHAMLFFRRCRFSDNSTKRLFGECVRKCFRESIAAMEDQFQDVVHLIGQQAASPLNAPDSHDFDPILREHLDERNLSYVEKHMEAAGMGGLVAFNRQRANVTE